MSHNGMQVQYVVSVMNVKSTFTIKRRPIHDFNNQASPQIVGQIVSQAYERTKKEASSPGNHTHGAELQRRSVKTPARRRTTASCSHTTRTSAPASVLLSSRPALQLQRQELLSLCLDVQRIRRRLVGVRQRLQHTVAERPARPYSPDAAAMYASRM